MRQECAAQESRGIGPLAFSAAARPAAHRLPRPRKRRDTARTVRNGATTRQTGTSSPAHDPACPRQGHVVRLVRQPRERPARADVISRIEPAC